MKKDILAWNFMNIITVISGVATLAILVSEAPNFLVTMRAYKDHEKAMKIIVMEALG